MVDVSLGIALLFVLGIGSQWLAWRVRLPSILLLLVAGFVAGPIFGWLDPDTMLGPKLITPLVGLSVAVILFEGGLTLHLRELEGGIGGVVRNLVSIGMIVTWLAVAGSAHWIFGLPAQLSLLLGAALVISGPTVVGPLLQHIRPTGAVGSILKWEGIVIDPVGAMIATLVFEALDGHPSFGGALTAAGRTILFGSLIGTAGATFLVLMLSRGWLPDRLEIPVTLTTVLAAAVASNHLQEESGLLATTVMGVALANQRRVSIKGILHFKENLVVLLISLLFVLLAARLERDTLFSLISWRGVGFLAVVLLLIRPLAVWLSTIGGKLNWKEKVFLACMAPRGIVSAAVVPLFALNLAEGGQFPRAQEMISITFLTIIGTVAVSGLCAPWIARRLGLAQASPQGVLILGANPIGLAVAKALQDLEVRALLVDTNWSNVRAARLEGLEAAHENLLEGDPGWELDLGGIGQLLACVPNDEVNTLASIHMAELFGRRNVFQIARHGEGDEKEPHAVHGRGRTSFDAKVDYGAFRRRLAEGERMKATRLSAEFTLDDFRAEHGEEALIMFVLDERGRLEIVPADEAPEPESGDTVVALVPTKKPVLEESASH